MKRGGPLKRRVGLMRRAFRCDDRAVTGFSLNRRPIARRTRLSPVSDAKRELDAEYNRRRIPFLAANPRCACGCGRRSEEVHHSRGKEGVITNPVTGEVEPRLICVPFFKAMAHVCHMKAENDPRWATARGLTGDKVAQA